MSRYDYDSDFSGHLSEDDDDSVYARPSKPCSKDRPIYRSGARATNHSGATGLEYSNERPIRRSNTYTFDTDHTDSKALTLRGDRSLSGPTTAPGRFRGDPIQRRHTFDDEKTDYGYRQPYPPRGESSHQSSTYSNRGKEATSYNIYGGHQTFIRNDVHIHVPPNTLPALGPSYTFSDDDDLVPSRRVKGKTRAEREDDDYQPTRRSRPSQSPSVTEEPTARKAKNKARRDAVIDRFAGELITGVTGGLVGKLFKDK